MASKSLLAHCPGKACESLSTSTVKGEQQYQAQAQDQASRPRPRLSKYGLEMSRDQDSSLENSMSEKK